MECPTHDADHFDLSDNKLTLASLPLPKENVEYIYAPQKPIQMPAMSSMANLSAEAAVGSNATVFTWKKTDGTVLTEGTDYVIQNGVTRFSSSDLGKVYCELTNEAFPLLAGENVLRTTSFTVMPSPTVKVAAFKVVQVNDTPQFIIAGNEGSQVFVDWTGTGLDLIPYDVHEMYTNYDVSEVATAGKDVTIYAYTAADVQGINTFSLYQMTLDNVDLTPPTGAYAISLGGAGLTEDNLQLPVAPGLGELNLEGNNFTSYPYAQAFPNVNLLNLASNNLTSFDASEIPAVSVLYISNNRLSDVKFNNPNLWSLFIDNNELETIDLSGLPVLEQVILSSNRLSEIDLEPVKNTLNAVSLVGNCFTFASLPLPSLYPRLAVYYYGNQAPMEVELVNNQVDLSAQATIDGFDTTFAWYRGVPTVNEDTGELEDDMLTEGPDYEIANGVTTFLLPQSEYVMGIMTNAVFPNLLQYTYLLDLSQVSVKDIEADNSREVKVYSIDGVLVRTAPKAQATDGLSAGIYIVDGQKVLVK